MSSGQQRQRNVEGTGGGSRQRGRDDVTAFGHETPAARRNATLRIAGDVDRGFPDDRGGGGGSGSGAAFFNHKPAIPSLAPLGSGSSVAGGGDGTQLAGPRWKEQDGVGACSYVVVVILVYGMSIVMLIASHIKRKNRKLLEDRQIDKYLKEFQTVRERSSRDNYRKMKRAMVVKLSTPGGFNSGAVHLPTTPTSALQQTTLVPLLSPLHIGCFSHHHQQQQQRMPTSLELAMSSPTSSSVANTQDDVISASISLTSSSRPEMTSSAGGDVDPQHGDATSATSDTYRSFDDVTDSMPPPCGWSRDLYVIDETMSSPVVGVVSLTSSTSGVEDMEGGLHRCGELAADIIQGQGHRHVVGQTLLCERCSATVRLMAACEEGRREQQRQQPSRVVQKGGTTHDGHCAAVRSRYRRGAPVEEKICKRHQRAGCGVVESSVTSQVARGGREVVEIHGARRGTTGKPLVVGRPGAKGQQRQHQDAADWSPRDHVTSL